MHFSNMADETRGGKYGRNFAIWVDYTIGTIPLDLRDDYRSKFLKELKNQSFKPRKEGEPRNEGCIHELSDIMGIDINDPIHFAKLVKEGIHQMYQKQNSARVLFALLENLKK